jgi:hypothetical protein
MNFTNWPDCETGTCSCRPVSDRRAIIVGRVAALVVALIALGLLLTVARVA